MSERGRNVARAAVLLMITVILSRILGYGREVALYTLFGQDYITDAYRAAFSIPDFIYMLLVGGALSSAFIPVISTFVARDQEEDAWRSASIVLNYVLLLMLFIMALAYLYTPLLMKILVPGLPAQYSDLAVYLTRIMFIQTFFMALNGMAMGILNSFHHFWAPAWGSLLYNLVIIVVGVGLEKQLGITAFSLGVVLGAVANFVVQIPALRRLGMKYYFSFDYKDQGFQEIIRLMVPVLAGLGAVQVSLFVTQNLASSLAAGTVSALSLAQRIVNLPLGIFAVSLGVAIFPTLTHLAARGEIAQFKRSSSLALRAVFLLTIPASLGLMALGEPIIRLLFEQGRFSATAVAITNEALFFYCFGLFAYSSLQVLNRSFYALHDSFTPVAAAFITIAANILLSLNLVATMGHKGLALAYSLSGLAGFIFLMLALRKKLGQLGGGRIVSSFLISLGASLVMWFLLRLFTERMLVFWPLTGKLQLLMLVGGGVFFGAIVYGLIIYFFKLEESQLLLNMLRQRLSKNS
ncbi:murein biosynthesis integral membrane protein MurJ [Syntrophomonas wolfei]|nr:murein biosynthesis integral membrane protein MurJ [Syntrophomonas wolfei]